MNRKRGPVEGETTVMSLGTRMRRVTATIRGLRHRATPDDNFIGFDKYSRFGAYHWKELEESPDYRAKVEFIGKYVHAGDHVLDIGCGDGAYMYRLSLHCASIIGIDADTEAVRLAKRELAAHHTSNATCFNIPLSQLTLSAVERTAMFDVIYSMDVIEHLPDPTELCKQIRMVGDDHTTVIVGTPSFLGDALVSPYHVREFSSDDLVALLSDQLHVDEVCLLPMLRQDGIVHDDGFIACVGRLR